MTRTAWWHCFAGIAGDMALASLLDAGADLEMVRHSLSGLPISGWALEVSETKRAGLRAMQLKVLSANATGQDERTWPDIRAFLQRDAFLPDRARRRAISVFGKLAAAEARVHGMSPDEVHFHEVGSIDSIVDVVGTCVALESLDVERVFFSPIALGTGIGRSSHGVLPHPAPAVVELLKNVPVQGPGHTRELTTPTGAALVAALGEGFGSVPAMKLVASGFGAGSADLGDFPNLLQVLVGEPAPVRVPDKEENLWLLETNLDDVTGEILAHTIARLLSAGALDAWLSSVTGKKGRPGHVLSALTKPEDADALALVMVTETGSLGIRRNPVSRWALPRTETHVDLEGWSIRVKRGPHRVKAEHDDCVLAAKALGLPVAEIARRAEQLASPAVTAEHEA